MEVSIWPRDLSLEDYAPAFRAHHIDAAHCRAAAEDLIVLGVSSVGHRRELLQK
jgi:hypothetical protein